MLSSNSVLLNYTLLLTCLYRLFPITLFRFVTLLLHNTCPRPYARTLLAYCDGVYDCDCVAIRYDTIRDLIVQLFGAVAFYFESSDFNLSPAWGLSWGLSLVLFCIIIIIIVIVYCLSICSALGCFFTIRQPCGAAGVVHMAALKNPHVQCPKKLDVVVVVEPHVLVPVYVSVPVPVPRSTLVT